MRHSDSQRGAAALAVTLLLLFGLTLIILFANRSFIFEQKTSANQFRATVAFEAAEAGIEWALAQLNDPNVLAAAPSCAQTATPVATSVSFRGRYLMPTAGTPAAGIPAGFYPPANARAACSIAANGALSCSCPAPGTAPAIASADVPRFRVEVRAVAGDPVAVELVATGCTSADAACGDAAGDTADAVSVSRTVVKLVPTFANAPAAALTSGSSTTVTGSLSVVNTDHATNGITINAGTHIDEGAGTTVATIPGTPPSASMLDNDSSLSTLSAADPNGDLYFQSFFGKPIEAYKQDPQTKVIKAADCSTATACGQKVSDWYDKGFQQFWVDPDIQFTIGNLPDAGTLGTADRPIFLAGAAKLELKASLTAYGMLYAAALDWTYTGSGSATIFGAMVARSEFVKGSGSLNVVYDSKVFGRGGVPTGLLVRVPGSWRDSEVAY